MILPNHHRYTAEKLEAVARAWKEGVIEQEQCFRLLNKAMEDHVVKVAKDHHQRDRAFGGV